MARFGSRALLALFFAPVLFTGCYFYKPELPTNKCQVSEQCPQGEACRNNRCEDIYYPANKVRQY